MPRIKRPRADSTIATTHLTMGLKIHGMTNAEILTLFNEGLHATADWSAKHP